jgi:hypothetical protein
MKACSAATTSGSPAASKNADMNRVSHMRRDQPRLAGNNRHGCLTTGMQQGRDDHQHPPATRAIPHHLNRRANRLMSSVITAPPHHWLANFVLVRLTLLITWRRVFWMLRPTPDDTEVSAD